MKLTLWHHGNSNILPNRNSIQLEFPFKIYWGKKYFRFYPAYRYLSGKIPAQGSGQRRVKYQQNPRQIPDEDRTNTGILQGLSAGKASGTVTSKTENTFYHLLEFPHSSDEILRMSDFPPRTYLENSSDWRVKGQRNRQLPARNTYHPLMAYREMTGSSAAMDNSPRVSSTVLCTSHLGLTGSCSGLSPSCWTPGLLWVSLGSSVNAALWALL